MIMNNKLVKIGSTKRTFGEKYPIQKNIWKSKKEKYYSLSGWHFNIIKSIAKLQFLIPSSPANDWRNLDRLYNWYVSWLVAWLVGYNAGGLGISKWSNLSLGMGKQSNMLKYWITEIMKYWSTEIMNCWNSEMLKGWHAKMLKLCIA